MREKNAKRVKGLIILLLSSVLVTFLIWKIIPTPKLDIELLSVDISNQITEGESNHLVINLKNNSKTQFNSSLNFKWIPDSKKGTPILIELSNIQILSNSTYSKAIDMTILKNHISTYKQFINSEFVISGDQNDKNNLVVKEISFYKKSQTSPILDIISPKVKIPTTPFIIDYNLNGKQVYKKFNNYEDLKKASIPKSVKSLNIDGKNIKSLMIKPDIKINQKYSGIKAHLLNDSLQKIKLN